MFQNQLFVPRRWWRCDAAPNRGEVSTIHRGLSRYHVAAGRSLKAPLHKVEMVQTIANRLIVGGGLTLLQGSPELGISPGSVASGVRFRIVARSSVAPASRYASGAAPVGLHRAQHRVHSRHLRRGAQDKIAVLVQQLILPVATLRALAAAPRRAARRPTACTNRLATGLSTPSRPRRRPRPEESRFHTGSEGSVTSGGDSAPPASATEPIVVLWTAMIYS